MALSALDDKAEVPTDKAVFEVLGETAGLWNELKIMIRSRFDPLSEDWGFAGKKWGWSLRLKHKKRAVLYMTPSTGFFLVGFALGQKAVDAAHERGLPEPVLDLIESSPKFAEGRGVRFEVRNADDLEHVIAVAEVKMAN